MMEKRRCPNCNETVPVLEQSLGTEVECHHCNTRFMAVPHCKTCGRPTPDGVCMCGGAYAPRREASATVSRSYRQRQAQGFLIAGLALALCGIAIVLMDPAGSTPGGDLAQHAPAGTVGLLLVDMSEIRASEALLPHAEELLAPLPLPEQIAAAALFLMPAPRVDQAAPFRVLLAGVAQYTDEAGDIAAAAQEKGAPTVVAGRDSYSMGGAYVTVLADGVLFFAHSAEALGQLLEAHLEGQMAPRELMNLCERVDGNALRMGVVWDENLRRLGPSLPFRASSDDVRQLALGVEGGEAVAFDGYVVLNNRTTAGKFAASLQAALPHMSVRGDEDVVRVAGMHAPGPAVGQVLRVTHQLLAPEPVIYDEATESETPAPEPDTQVESFE